MVIYELFCLFEEVLIGMTGFEPAASSSRTKRATGLRYIPQLIIVLNNGQFFIPKIGSQKYLYLTNNQIVLTNFYKIQNPGLPGLCIL